MKKHARIGYAFLSIVLASPCAPAWSQGASLVEDRYFHSLGVIMSKIRGVQYTADICAERYPATKEANQRAAEDWRDRYQPFIGEMTAAFNGLPRYWAGRNKEAARAGPAMWAQVNRQLDGAKLLLEQQYLAQLGEEKFAIVCANYAMVLQAPGADLERTQVQEVATIRRGPK